MKTKMMFTGIMLIAVALGFTACSDDDNDHVSQDKVPAAVQETFSQIFPMASPKWEMEYGMYKAEWKEDGLDIDAWFQRSGEWKCTDRDVRPSALPQAVNDYIAANYEGYYIDDVNYMETPDGNYYDIELEKRGAPDVNLKITADGTIISYGFEPWKDSDGDVAAKDVPKAVMQTFRQMYPDVTSQWERERGIYDAEWKDGTVEFEAWFKADGTWMMTKQDMLPTSIPAAVTAYISDNYPDYKIDDAYYIETPDGTYYLVEIEKQGARDIYLRLDTDGTLLP